MCLGRVPSSAGKKILFAHSVLLQTLEGGPRVQHSDFQTIWQISADEPLHNSQVEAPTPKCLTKIRQDCGLPKRDLFMTTGLILVNFENGGKLFRVFPNVYPLMRVCRSVSNLEIMH
jgi:hypothetical protein